MQMAPLSFPRCAEPDYIALRVGRMVATGVVQKFAFTNPHGALHIAIKNAQGEVKVWQLTTGSANVLTNAGVSATGPNRIKSGDELTVTFNPAVSGATIGFLRSMVLPDKKEVEFVPN